MLYTLEQGPTEREIVEQSYRSGRPLPNAIANAPVLWLGLDLFLDAFFVLTSTRSVGFGEGPIPWTAVSHWCDVHGVFNDQREDVHFHMGKLDTAYLKYRSKKIGKSDGSPTVRTENEGTRRSR